MTQIAELDKAQLAIYAALSIPVLYLLFRHGLPGLIGWLYLFAFCMLRVIGGALATSKGPTDETAAIISNIGLSPLLLATSGILHEVRYYRSPNGTSKGEWSLVLIFHILVTSGLALLASGASAFKPATPGSAASSIKLAKVGVLILLVAWVIVVLWTFVTLLPSQTNRSAMGYRSATILLYSVMLALPLIGVRMLYSVISILAPSQRLNPVTGEWGLRLGLSFVPELVAALGFIAAGIMTQRVRSEAGSAGVKTERTRRRRHRSSAV